MFTKTEIVVLKLLCSKLTKFYTIRGISKEIKKSYPITYQAANKLIEKKIILKDENKLLSLNPLSNFSDLAYIESLRADDFIKKHREIKSFMTEVLGKIDSFFTLLVFGSYAVNQQTKNSDLDLLMIIDDDKNTGKQEIILKRSTELYLKKSHCHVISRKDVKEMIKERKKLNVINETLDKHIIVYGAEEYYRLIKDR